MLQKYLLEYFRMARLYKTFNFLFVVFGYGIASMTISVEMFGKLVLFYFLFAVFIYGALYVFNSIEDDLGVEVKTYRVQLSFIIISISFGLIGLYFVFPKTLLVVVTLILLNIMYSRFLKKISLPLGIITIATTGSLKILLGVILAGGSFALFVPLLVCNYLSSVCFHSLRNHFKGTLSMVVLKILYIFCITALMSLTFYYFITGSLIDMYICIFYILFCLVSLSVFVKNNIIGIAIVGFMHLR